MNPLLITPLLDLAKGLIGKVWPDPAQQAEAQARLLELQQRGELAELDAQLKLQLAQIETNKLDAVGNFMQRGWRPFIGWVGGFALAYQFIGQPLMAWVAINHGWQAPPALASDMLFSLVTQLLGLGVLRTTEKLKGQA
jgi:Holin of 3TMs, for gene-transfer release